MTLTQWIALGVSAVAFGSLLLTTVWAVRGWGAAEAKAAAWQKMAMRVPRVPALTQVAPAYHAPREQQVTCEPFSPWGESVEPSE